MEQRRLPRTALPLISSATPRSTPTSTAPWSAGRSTSAAATQGGRAASSVSTLARTSTRSSLLSCPSGTRARARCCLDWSAAAPRRSPSPRPPPAIPPCPPAPSVVAATDLPSRHGRPWNYTMCRSSIVRLCYAIAKLAVNTSSRNPVYDGSLGKPV